MFKFLFLVSLMSLLLLSLSCSKKTFDLSTYQKSYLIFGQGGGITGLRIEYLLLEDGNMYRRNAVRDSLEFLKTTERAFAKQSFENYFTLGLDRMQCYEPGDIYYYVEYHDRGQTQRLVWGKPGFIPPEILVAYFNNLYRTAKTAD